MLSLGAGKQTALAPLIGQHTTAVDSKQAARTVVSTF